MSQSIFDLLQTGRATDLILDFDDTICIHRDPPDYHEGPDRMARFRDCIEGTCDHYLKLHREGANTELPGIRYLLKYAQGTGINVFALSHSTLSIYLDAKRKWIDGVLGRGLIKHVVGVPSAEAKIRFLKEYMEYMEYKDMSRGQDGRPAHVIYVEDIPELRLAASKIPGITAFSPQDVAASWHELAMKSKGGQNAQKTETGRTA